MFDYAVKSAPRALRKQAAAIVLGRGSSDSSGWATEYLTELLGWCNQPCCSPCKTCARRSDVLPPSPGPQDSSHWPEALVAAVDFLMELLHCFASAARLELEEAGGDATGERELSEQGEDQPGWRYLPAVCVLLEWMRLHSKYMQLLLDEEAATALWSDIVRLVMRLPPSLPPPPDIWSDIVRLVMRLLPSLPPADDARRGAARAAALQEDLELRGFPPLEAALVLRVGGAGGIDTAHPSRANRLRLSRIRAFAEWAAAGGIPNAIFFHPEVNLFSADGVPPAPPRGLSGGTHLQEEEEEEEAGDDEMVLRDPPPDLLPPPPASLALAASAPSAPSAPLVAAGNPVPDPLDLQQVRGLLVGVDLGAGNGKGHGGGGGGGGGNSRGRQQREGRRQHSFPTPARPGGFAAESTDELKELQASETFSPWCIDGALKRRRTEVRVISWKTKQKVDVDGAERAGFFRSSCIEVPKGARLSDEHALRSPGACDFDRHSGLRRAGRVFLCCVGRAGISS
eukprot:1191285-Prorocentrum_minimum.AAC.1